MEDYFSYWVFVTNEGTIFDRWWNRALRKTGETMTNLKKKGGEQ